MEPSLFNRQDFLVSLHDTKQGYYFTAINTKSNKTFISNLGETVEDCFVVLNDNTIVPMTHALLHAVRTEDGDGKPIIALECFILNTDEPIVIFDNVFSN